MSDLPDDLSPDEYRALAEFRYLLRRFLHFSEQAAREAELEPRQHQLLLALKGRAEGTRMSIGELAERLQAHHHSTVELVDRLVARGLVERTRGEVDRRQVFVELTPAGEAILRRLALHHREELRTMAPRLLTVLEELLGI